MGKKRPRQHCGSEKFPARPGTPSLPAVETCAWRWWSPDSTTSSAKGRVAWLEWGISQGHSSQRLSALETVLRVTFLLKWQCTFYDGHKDSGVVELPGVSPTHTVAGTESTKPPWRGFLGQPWAESTSPRSPAMLQSSVVTHDCGEGCRM